MTVSDMVWSPVGTGEPVGGLRVVDGVGELLANAAVGGSETVLRSVGNALDDGDRVSLGTPL